MKDGSVRSPFCDALERQLRDRPDHVAVESRSERRSVTFSQLDARISSWSRLLRAAGVEEGQPAGLATGNTLSFPELFFALRSLGAPVLTLDDTLPPAAAAETAARMGARWLLLRNPAATGSPLSGAPDGFVRLLPLTPACGVPAGTAVIKLTSGSTLDPRGACFTEEALMEGIAHILEGMEIRTGDRVLISIPLSHSYGFDNGVLSLAAGGTPLILQDDVVPGAILRTMREREITFFPAVPALVRALGQVAWPKGLALRRVISASAPLSAEAAADFTRASGLRVSQFLGATEAGGISFEPRPEDPAAEGTVGFPLPGVRIEIAENDLVRIHSKANRFALLPEQSLTGYVETGDRGALTPEGRLRLLGRAAQVANIAGIKVDLGAIEAFFRSLPGVDDAATLPMDDPARGDRIVAFVETIAQTPGTLLQICRERLSAREVPSEIRVVPRLPRTARGKLDRAALAALPGGGR